MNNDRTAFELAGLILFILVLASCGQDGGSSSTAGSTLNAFYSKGPVTGASALLKNANGDTVAGPVITESGFAVFEDVAYRGLAYVAFSGGTYTDEATGIAVTLESGFTIRSGVINLKGSETRKITGTPLTEIGFQRAVAQNGGIANLDTVNAMIGEVADEYGLDGIDLTVVVPTASGNTAGSGNEDRYAAVLAALSQQLRNNSQQPTAASLQNYIDDNVVIVDRTGFATAVRDILTNPDIPDYINSTAIDSIIPQIGTGAPLYVIGGSASGLAGSVELQNNNADNFSLGANGVFAFSENFLNGESYNVTVATQPTGQTCRVSNASGTVVAADVGNVTVRCDHNVNYVDFAISGSPVGTYWYLGDGQWERETWYDCLSFSELGLGESTILLRDVAGAEDLEINIHTMTITSNSTSEEVFGFGSSARPPESNTTCPSTSNDHTPLITSATEVEVNSGRTLVALLTASDADLPPEDLFFSLSDNAETDNDQFKLTNFSEKSRAACRAGNANQGHPGDPNNDNYFLVEPGVNSLEQCQAACNLHPLAGGSGFNCRGIEYRAQDAEPLFPDPRCELWKAPIAATVPQPGYSCYTRKSERPEVLSFANAPDFRTVLDANADNVYEIEAAVFDGPDGNGSTQNIRVTVVPNGEYIGRSRTACRAGTQNEGHPEDINNSNYFTVVNHVDTLDDCQALCDAYPLVGDPSVNCSGIEYREEGADYADTVSRCEIWNVPIVATTPQAEYACYVRDYLRDPYGPDDSAYVGDYKAFRPVDGDSDIDYFVYPMSLSQGAPGQLVWNDCCRGSWTLTRTADRHILKVGPDYPNADVYVEAEVIWDAEEVVGIVGPSGSVYRTDWARAKFSHSQAIYRSYIEDHPSELIRVAEAERQIRELKWGIANEINTAEAYRGYKNAIGTAYGRTDEADRRIESFIAYVTAEVLGIEVDESVSFFGEDNDLELFYTLEFTKDDQRPRPDEVGWSDADLLLESVWNTDCEQISDTNCARKFTKINDGVDRIFFPAGNAERTLVANETQSLRYGGLMFEYDSEPEWPYIPDCADFSQTVGCREPGFDWESFFLTDRSWTVHPNIPYIDGIFDARWNGNRTWAGNAATASESLAHTYFGVSLADLEYGKPQIETKTISFESDEIIRLSYGITKRDQAQYEEYLEDNNPMCDEPVLKSEKLEPRRSVSIEGPGFLIRNETDHTYSVSLDQVGPLYYGELRPGKIFRRDTAWGHFTIDALVNLTGEQRYDNWDVFYPIAVFTAETLLTVLTAGSASTTTTIGGLINRSAVTLGARLGSVAGARLAQSAIGRALLSAGRRAFAQAAIQANRNVLIKIVGRAGLGATELATDSVLDLAFTSHLVDLIYDEDATEENIIFRHSGFYGSTIEMYHIVGGPRLPCLNSDGDIEIRSSDLQILSHDECKSRPDICILN